MIPKTNFLGAEISRLVLGDNPVHGHSYIPEIFPGSEMLDYYTEHNFMNDMENAQACGINAFMFLANEFTLRSIRHHRLEGYNSEIIFQSFPPVDFSVNVRQMSEFKPLGIYHQGTTLDGLCEEGNFQIIKDRIKMIHDAGIPAGIGTHVPETVLRAEEENWGVDFYVTCLHNTQIRGAAKESSFITGKPKHLKFFTEDRPRMYEVIRAVDKPFIAFKIFSGGQIFYNKTPEQISEAARGALTEAYENIKHTDVCCVGCFQRDKDQIRENAQLVGSILGNE